MGLLLNRLREVDATVMSEFISRSEGHAVETRFCSVDLIMYRNRVISNFVVERTYEDRSEL